MISTLPFLQVNAFCAPTVDDGYASASHRGGESKALGNQAPVIQTESGGTILTDAGGNMLAE